MTQETGTSFPFLKARHDAVELLVYAAPRGSRSKVVGEHNGRLKLALAAPPVDGKANQELERFLAETFSLSKSRVSLVSGQSSKQKLVLLSGITLQSATDLVRKLLQKS